MRSDTLARSPGSLARRSALVLVCALALLVIAPAAGAATISTPTATPAPSSSSSPASAPSRTQVVAAGGDPCSLLFGSVKAACEKLRGGSSSPSPSPSTSSGSGSGSSGSGSGSTSLLDIPGQVEQAIDGWFGDLVKSALSPILTLLGELVLATPNLTGGRMAGIWQITLSITDAAFVLMVVVGGIIVMSHESVQTRYGLKQILPRLVTGFIAANTSLLLVGHAVALGNALTLAIWNTPVSGAGIGNQLLGYIIGSIFLPDGVTQIFMIMIGLVLAGLALAVVFSFALRTAGLLLLIVLAPPMLACHALPGLDAIAQLWWRAIAAVMAIGFLQAAVLMLMLQVFFDPDSNVFGIPTAAGLIDLVVCGALFVILLKIPGWVLRMILGRSPRATVSGLVRTAAMAAVGSAVGVPGAGSARMLAGRLTGNAVSAALPGPPSGPGTGPRPSWTRPIPPNFGTAHGRPAAGGQGVLFPIPKGARLSRAEAQRRTDMRSGRLRGGWSAPTPSSTRARFQQLALFNRAGQIASSSQPSRPENPAEFGTAHGRVGPGGQGALFPIPKGARQPAAPAPQQAAEPDQAPGSGPRFVQPGLFPDAPAGPIRGRQQALFPIPPGARRPRPAPAPTPSAAPAPTGRSGPRPVQPGLFPPSGILPPTPAPRPAGTAPRAESSGAPAVPPAPAPRLVPVRLTAAPPPVRPRRRRGSRSRKGGEQS